MEPPAVMSDEENLLQSKEKTVDAVLDDAVVQASKRPLPDTQTDANTTEDGAKRAKVKVKRIPNIAEELAKNRNNVRGTSPRPSSAGSNGASSSSSAGGRIAKQSNVVEVSAIPATPIPEDTKFSQLKISSLLSPTHDENEQKPSTNTSAKVSKTAQAKNPILQKASSNLTDGSSEAQNALPEKAKRSKSANARTTTKAKTSKATKAPKTPGPTAAKTTTRKKTTTKTIKSENTAPSIIPSKEIKIEPKPTTPSATKNTETKKKSVEPSSSAKPKSPRKLTQSATLKSPSLINVFEKEKNSKDTEEPVVVMDIPLYPSSSNEYLDENGQVVFNFYKILKDKFAPVTKTTESDELIQTKRNLIGQLNDQGHKSTEDEGDDIITLDDNAEEDDDENEDGDEDKAVISPKKKSHPNKGKNLIGKYDIEDPFIDDSELLWEEQRAATKDGFFVYFGPLIEKGHYASFERSNGTMKRGGVKNPGR